MWSYGLDLRSIRLTIVKVVVNTCNNCFAKAFNYSWKCSSEIFDFPTSNWRFLNFCLWGFGDKR